MNKVKKYYSNQSFITLKKHEDYVKKYAKRVIVIKNNKDIEKVLETLK